MVVVAHNSETISFLSFIALKWHTGRRDNDPPRQRRRVTGTHHRPDLALALPIVGRDLRPGAEPPPARERQRGIQRALRYWLQRDCRIRLLHVRRPQCLRDAAIAVAASRQHCGAHLGKGAIIDIAQCRHAIGHVSRLNWRAFPAALTNFAAQIIG